MLDYLQVLSLQLGIPMQTLLIAGLATGALLLFGAVASAFQRNPAALRIAALAGRRQERQDRGLLRAPDATPGGIMKSFIPGNEAERSELQRRLSQAGHSGPHALRNFTLVRVVFGLFLPGLLLALIFASKTAAIPLPAALTSRVSGLSNLAIFQSLSLLVGIGYFGPLYWLRARVTARQRKIEEGFPNALDLMQISVEAGLGFDAAMTRVGNELATVSPEIAFEFLSVQRQIAAGRPREAAMQDMARRTGVEMMRSFANVVQQSMQFGTSMAEALTTYATEMRAYREMRAQEMANKLPVKMSAVLAALMLPALILLTIGPVVIRYIRYFSA